MKEAIVRAGPKVEIVDSEIPKAGKNQLVIKVVYSGCNPKDWKIPDMMGIEVNGGDDIAGTVHEVGQGVFGFKVGDRVAAFHEMCKPGGSYAEYSVAWDHTTIHLPENISFEEAATLPLASLTSCIGLYAPDRLALPPPWTPLPSTTQTPIIVYGGASAVGAYCIQLLQKSNIHPIITIAGKGIPFVKNLISPEKGDVIIDYRYKSPAELVTEMKQALNGKQLHHAFDAVSDHGSYENLGEVLAEEGKITLVLPGKDYSALQPHVVQTITKVGDVHTPEFADLGFVCFQMIARGLREGWFKPHPFEVIVGGLGGIQEGLERLKEGRVSAVKFIYKIADTDVIKS